jgi:hypothetical protein
MHLRRASRRWENFRPHARFPKHWRRYRRPRFDLARGVLLAAGAVTAAASLFAQSTDARLTADVMKSFAFRSVGPSLTTGRISDVAVDPKNPSVWYVAV